jgi:hypothetical protein
MSISSDLLELRRLRLARSGAYPIHSQEEALAFLADVGFCRFSHHGECELPCFSDALAPEVAGELWGWKDALPNTRRVYYGTLFQFNPRDSVRPGFLSLPVLAALYSLSYICQFGGERDMLSRWAGISREAVSLADALERDGSLSTQALRAATGLRGKEHASLFHKALVEAQRQFLVVRTGVTSVTRANYGYVWDTFDRVYPAAVQEARALDELSAAAALVCQYVDVAVQVPVERIADVLSLDLKLLRKAADRLIVLGELEALPGTPPPLMRRG